MKKGIIIVIGISILAVGGYTISSAISKNKVNKNTKVVRLENGQELRINNSDKKGEFNREGDRPDVIGKIKEMNDDSIVIEQFDMSKMRAGRGSGEGVGSEDSAERPEPTVAGEVTIALADETSYVKGAERRRGQGESEIEEISKNDLEEGDMVSVWTLDGGDIAERIMVR